MPRPAPARPVRPLRILAAGDVHGDFAALAERTAAARERYGPVDAILAVGDVEANRDEAEAAGVTGPAKYRKVGDFPLVADGRLVLGAPLYFIGGNHEPWPALDEAGPGWWTDTACFLGRAGVTDVLGLRVAYLSGIHSARVTDAPRPRRDTAREKTYYTADEVRQVARAARGRPVDVLLTHDWPAGIAGTPPLLSVGRPELRDLCERVRPQWHLCGHMHRRHRAVIGPTQVLCLGQMAFGPDAVAVLERDGEGRLILAGEDEAAP